MVAVKILSATEMQTCDRLTTEQYGVPSLQLMRAAAKAVAAFALERFPRARRVTVLCGRGNNGGDGMMAARLLSSAGLEVTTLLLGEPETLAGDAADAWCELVGAGRGTIAAVKTPEELARHDGALEADLIVDALVGTGFKPPLRGLALAALDWLKTSGAVQIPILAIDLPSGWAADETSATVDAPVFPADAVITFTAPKPAHVFGHLTRRWDQPVVVAPIGSPAEAIASELGLHWAGSAMELAQAPRGTGANKGNFGHVLVVGGTFGTAGGKAGAPSMTALGALRAGAGLVTAAVPAPALALVSGVAPELMTWPLVATVAGEIAAENQAPEIMAALTKGKTVLAVGPGLGQAMETIQYVSRLLMVTRIPVVIDADALNILSRKAGMLGELMAVAKRGRTVVLTPHPGEMARLAETTIAEVQAKRLEVARGFAQRSGFIVVLKGARTLIAHPDGRVSVNTTGNPGMAKGGSGDLLTGIVAGMLAQHPDEPVRAVEAAVYLHGLAADLTVREADEHTLLATDSIAQFSRAFRFRNSGSKGYVWLQGLPPKPLPAAVPLEGTQ
jgi:NAD(P)H-hydrate epimerase